MSDELARAAAARENNLVVLAPPDPVYLRGVFASVAALEGKRLALVAGVSARACGGATALTPARLSRLLLDPTASLVFTTPESAHEALRRSALKPADLAGVLLLWPEAWDNPALADELLQDLPKEAQRIVVTADRAATAGLVERHAWRAAEADLIGPDLLEEAPPVRTFSVSRDRRETAVAELVELLDPASHYVWRLGETGGRGPGDGGGTGGTGGAGGRLIVAWDLPTPATLRELAALGDVVLLVPPGTEAYVQRIAPNRRPIQGMALDAARNDVARTRRRIAEEVEKGGPAADYVVLAPLLERFEASAVAAALYRLWQAQPTPEPAPVAPPARAQRLWVGAGKRDGATAADLVAVLVREAGVPRQAIGKIEIRESFAVVELGEGQDLAQIAERVAGKSIRKRRLAARPDRGASRSPRGG